MLAHPCHTHRHYRKHPLVAEFPESRPVISAVIFEEMLKVHFHERNPFLHLACRKNGERPLRQALETPHKPKR